MKPEIILLSLISLPGVGSKTALKFYSSLTDKTEDEDTLFDQIRIFRDEGNKFPDVSKSMITLAFSKTESWVEKSLSLNHKIISIYDDNYPSRLKTIENPPVVIFVKGNLKAIASEKAAALIGTRNASKLGLNTALKIGMKMGENSIVVVSGLAIGCDTEGHKGCLEKNGIGIGVLAHGLDNIYPSASKGLSEKLIESGGLLLTEYPPGTTPTKYSFVERDRVQSGLSDFVFVAETSEKSGTMHTVKFAEDQRRPLVCLDFPEDAYDQGVASGNKMLIKEDRAIPYSLDEDFSELLDRIYNQEVVETKPEKKRPEQKSFDF